MQIKRFSSALLGAALIFAAALAQDGVSLKRAPKVGDTFKYNLSVAMNIQGQDFTVTAVVSEKVTKAEEGKYTIESNQTELKLNGQEAPMEQSPSYSTYSNVGRLLESKSDQEGPDADRMSALQSFEVPDKAVKVGDTWEVALKAKEGKNPVAFKASYKVEAQEKVGEWDTLKISFTATETEGTDPAKSVGTVWVSVKDGSMVKYEGNWTNAPIPMAGPTTAKVTLMRTA